ncbi:hypothetical protein [Neobacillus cucumis]|uniref:Uncharacterized protein n=1 Tax=Neobacillus cucumis TaxID=1740721 RepID=A0A2N5HA03_9BACI|nr:hypothetical protein [Neobacillus cucumis]PLS02349.1 hypothetical protein CVD27_20435 [Neobacillus cucumis]
MTAEFLRRFPTIDCGIKEEKVQTRNFDHLEVSGDNVLNGEGAYSRHLDSELSVYWEKKLS